MSLQFVPILGQNMTSKQSLTFLVLFITFHRINGLLSANLSLGLPSINLELLGVKQTKQELPNLWNPTRKAKNPKLELEF